MSAMPLAASWSAPNECLPIGVCTFPALSTRNSTLPALTSRTARATSKVTVPSFGFGMSPRGPSTLPSRPTCPIRSGVPTAVSNSIQPPCTRSTRSSAPITSAPASRASRSFSPLAKTATRTVLPMPGGSTTAPRTIWSACLGSTPSRKDRSTDSANFAPGIALRTPIASSSECCLSGATFATAASYRLLTIVAMFVSVSALNDVDAHAAGGAFDDAHRGVHVVGVEVDQLGLGDLAHLLLGDLADLVLVRDRRGLGDAGRALEQHGRRRRLHHEGEGPVLVDRHHHRQDQALFPPGLRVEALAELHDVDAVLAEGRAHRRRGIGLAGRDLQLDDRLQLLH